MGVFRNKEYKSVGDVLTLDCVKRWMKLTGHSHFTNESVQEFIKESENFLGKTLGNAVAITEHRKRMTILLSDVLDALRIEGHRFYGTGPMPTVATGPYHPTELRPTFLPTGSEGITLVEMYEENIEDEWESEDDLFDFNESETEGEETFSSDEEDHVEEHSRAISTTDLVHKQMENAQRMLDELEDDECSSDDSDQETEDDVSELIWEEFKTDGGVYYQMTTQTEMDAVIPSYMMKRKEFNELVYVVMAQATIPLEMSPAAVSALHQSFETHMQKALSEGVLGWKIAKQAMEWRYLHEADKLKKAQEEIEAMKAQHEKQMKQFQQDIEVEKMGGQKRKHSAVDEKEKGPVLTRFQALQRTFSRKKKRIAPVV